MLDLQNPKSKRVSRTLLGCKFGKTNMLMIEMPKLIAYQVIF
jgi:hypothetical protein